MRNRAMTAFVVVGLSLAAVGCKGDDKPQNTPPPGPPPPGARAAASGAASAKPAACAGGGGRISDKVSAPFFPQTAGDFCLDPNGGEKTFGEQATLQLDQICDLFDGECEIYKGFNVRRVVEARYVDGKGSPATIDIYLSKFATSEAAYGMFTKRVVGENDPAGEDTPKAIEGGGAAALGLGNAYLWRGAYLAEITYNDEAANEPAIKAAGEKLLPPLVKQMGDKLPGEAQLPGPVLLLPKEGMVPLGMRYVTKDVLGVDGVGGGAFGYYKEGDDRWRVASIARADAEQAKDVLASFAKVAGATKEKNVGEGAVRLTVKEAEGVPTEWLFARSGKNVIGIGDEPRVLKVGMTAEETAKVTLTKDEKIERLKKVLPAP